MPASKHRRKGRPRTRLNSATEATKPAAPLLDEQLEDEHFRDGIRALLNEVCKGQIDGVPVRRSKSVPVG